MNGSGNVDWVGNFGVPGGSVWYFAHASWSNMSPLPAPTCRRFGERAGPSTSIKAHFIASAPVWLGPKKEPIRSCKSFDYILTNNKLY